MQAPDDYAENDEWPRGSSVRGGAFKPGVYSDGSPADGPFMHMYTPMVWPGGPSAGFNPGLTWVTDGLPVVVCRSHVSQRRATWGDVDDCAECKQLSFAERMMNGR